MADSSALTAGAAAAIDTTRDLTFDRPTRTELHCHECGKGFIGLIDFSITGNHIVECPHCGHEHCRVIKDGKITGDRWDSRHGGDKTRDGIKVRRVWKHDSLPARTSAVSEFLRQRWLERAEGT